MTKTNNLETPIDYQQLVEVIGDAVVVADTSGAINLWNPAAERLFGFTQAEALGNSLDLIIPERLRERHWAGYRKTMASGETRYSHDVLRVPSCAQRRANVVDCIYGRIALRAATRGYRNRGRDP